MDLISDRIGELLRERQKAVALLHGIDRRLMEVSREETDLTGAVAEAEERGDWRLAARLRRQQRPRLAAPQ